MSMPVGATFLCVSIFRVIFWVWKPHARCATGLTGLYFVHVGNFKRCSATVVALDLFNIASGVYLAS